ncbi:MAG: ribosome silencing factor [Clostridia bacterium]|nr:ribosome silencing factor [Clostridia bacterium]
MVKILDAKKAKDIKLLHVEEQTVIADYFVIATGNSTTQVSSLSEEVEYRLSQHEITPRAIEGQRGDSWILSDYSCVILHVFSQESRDFYKLEKLYSEGSEVSIADILTED